MDDELGGMYQEKYGGELKKPIPITEKKPMRYHDMFPEDLPKPGVIGNIRTGFGHLAQLPGDIAEYYGAGKVFPETLQSAQGALQSAGEFIAGGDLGRTDTGIDWLMQAIREQIRQGGPGDVASRIR